MTIFPGVNIKVNWDSEKGISLPVWGSITFNYLCLSRLWGTLHPQTPAPFKEKGWDRLRLLVGLGTTWAASPSPDGSVYESAQPALDLTLNSHFQPEGMGVPAGQKEIEDALGFEAYQPRGCLSFVSEM